MRLATPSLRCWPLALLLLGSSTACSSEGAISAPLGSGGAAAGGAADGPAGASGGAATAGDGRGGAPVDAPDGAPYVSRSPTIGGCTVFSGDDPWQKDVSGAAVDPTWTSALFAQAMKKTLHPDFGNSGTAVYGIPINVVPPSQGPVAVAFEYADESDPGPYPFPSPDVVKIEGGTATACDGDCHVLLLVQGACRLFEAWNCHYASGWRCGSGASFDLARSSYGQRPAGHTSADAAGLAITPGLVRFSEVAAGAVLHAIRFTMHCTQDGYVAPASHFAVPIGGSGCPAQGPAESLAEYHNRLRSTPYPPMGLRIRLKSTHPIAGLSEQAKVIAQAMMTYGMILADNGSDYYFQGDADPGWNEQLEDLKAIPGDAFEVLSAGPVTH